LEKAAGSRGCGRIKTLICLGRGIQANIGTLKVGPLQSNTVREEKMSKKALAILVSGLWIAVSEFGRNEWLFKFYWVEHFQKLGLRFETLPVNGSLWLVWSLLMAWLVSELLT
jgi:hypothetical protein